MIYDVLVRSGRPEMERFAERLREEIEATGGAVGEDRSAKPDMVLAVGGDGTMLAAAQRAVDWDVPVLGFNLGTLGFLTEAEPDDLSPVVKRLATGDFEVAPRLTVAAAIDDRRAVGINDVVVEKIDSTRLVSLTVLIDGNEFTNYRADGLIIATPTGSTAYSFSAGGPIIDPRVEALVLTPVASHSLFDRPLVLPADAKIEVIVHRDRLVRVNVDKTDLGQLGEAESVTIEKGQRPVKFVTFGSWSFPGLVREKFRLE